MHANPFRQIPAGQSWAQLVSTGEWQESEPAGVCVCVLELAGWMAVKALVVSMEKPEDLPAPS